MSRLFDKFLFKTAGFQCAQNVRFLQDLNLSYENFSGCSYRNDFPNFVSALIITNRVGSRLKNSSSFSAGFMRT